MITVLHIIVGLNVGGAELMLKRLICHDCDRNRIKHKVISLTTIGTIGTILINAGIEVDALHMNSFADSPRVLLRLINEIKLTRPNIVQTWMYHSDFIGGIAARIAGCKKLVWGIRTTDISAGGSRVTAAIRWMCARMSNWVPHTMVCAAEASRHAHISIGYRADRMVVISNGFDLARMQASPDQVEQLRKICGFDDLNLVVGTLGRFHPVKDQHNFVTAAGIVARAHANVRFLMVGRHCDPMNVQLNQWIEETGFANRFVLLGERSDAPVCLAAMDIFCMSSRTEGFPNVVGEAMAMRRVCVVTDVGDAAYLLGGFGQVVCKEDHVAFAAGIDKLVALSAYERHHLGDLSYNRIATEFTMARAHEKFTALYSEVLAD